MNGKANPMAVQGMSAATFGMRGMAEQSRVNLFAQMFAIGAALVIIVVAGLYLYLDRVEKDRLAATWELRAERLADRFHATVQTLEIHIDVLARDPALRRYINSRRDEDRRDAERELLAAVTGWQAIARVRYIDADGWERIRVDQANGASHAVPADELQYKGERPYFKSASLLPPNSLYLSRLDLNMENGEIEVPWRPMIRIAAPEFDDTGSPAGIMVVNVLPDPLLKGFYEHRGDGHNPNQPMLLADDGSWIFGAPKEKQWGFMFGGRAGLHLDNPAVWNAITSADSGAHWDGDVLYSFATIWPNGEITLRSELGGIGTSVVSPVKFWKVVHATTRTTVPFLARTGWMMAAAALLLVGVLAWLWSGATYHRRLAERGERSAQIRGRALLDRTEAAIYILDFDHRFLRVNEKYCRMVGKSEAVLLGTHVLDSVPRQVRVAWEETIAPFLDDPYAEARDVEFSFEFGGERKYFLTNYFPLVDADGEPDSRAFVAIDISELKRVQQSLVAAQEQAIDASEAKSRFLANMSHELRTPLSSIIGYAEMLDEEAAEDGMDRYRGDIQRIVESGQHLLSLINDILDLSKIEAGRLELSIEDTTVGAILDEVLSTTAPLVELNRNKLTVDCQVRELGLRTDTTRLRQILLNLLGNAAKFTANGEITLSCRVADRQSEPSVIFEVADTGIGMTPKTLESLFEEFSQADSSSSKRYEGTGLGLAICKRLVQLFGGSIGVESEKDVGSRFTVQIPLNSGHDTVAAQALPAVALNSLPPNRSNARRPSSVLVIDDDANSRALLTRYITSAGMQVVTASSGAEGIERAQQIRPEAITLDVFMKGLSGWDVLRQLKENPSLRDIPVIMCTMSDDRRTAVSLGAMEHLTKPISRDKYLAAIRRHAPELPGGVVLVIDDLPENRAIYSRQLAGLDVEIVEARNGQEAFEKLAKIERLRCVMLDLLMPEMDGFEFLKRFRQTSKWRTVPVFVVTAKSLTAAEREALSQSAQTVICREGRPVGDVLNEIKADLDRQVGATTEN